MGLPNWFGHIFDVAVSLVLLVKLVSPGIRVLGCLFGEFLSSVVLAFRITGL